MKALVLFDAIESQLQRIVLRPWHLVALTSLLLLSGYVMIRGVVMSPDSHTYSAWAERLLVHNYDVFAYLSDVNFPVPPIMYLGFVSLVALAKDLFGNHWNTAIVLLNIVVHTASVTLVSRMVEELSGSRLAALVVGLLFLACLEVFLWVPYVLSDTTFMGLASLYLAVASMALMERRGRRAWLLSVVALSTLMLVFRPTAVPLIAATVLTLCWVQVTVAWQQRSQARVVGVLLLVGFAVASIGGAYVMQAPERWPIEFAKEGISALSHYYDLGCVVHDRPQTFLAPPETYAGYLGLFLYRYLFFFVFLLEAFSGFHNFVNLLVFVPVYGLGLVAVVEMFRSDSCFSRWQWNSGLLALVMVIFTAMFASFLLIDYDWRYRLPVMPAMFMLAGLGMVALRVRLHEDKSPAVDF